MLPAACRLPPSAPLPPQVTRLELVLTEVDRHLGELCGRVHDALPPRLARAVCAALVTAVQSVLLDGGPYRCAAAAAAAAAAESSALRCSAAH